MVYCRTQRMDYFISLTGRRLVEDRRRLNTPAAVEFDAWERPEQRAVLGPAAETEAAIKAEAARVKALPEPEQRSLGKKYTEPELLFDALDVLQGQATQIIRASWLKTQRGGRLPKRGDLLPKGAIISVAELRAIFAASSVQYNTLPVISLSHFWRTKAHPDPDGETLELVISALEQRWGEFTEKRVKDLGILIDWCGLYQAPRTDTQAEVFGAALKAINQWSVGVLSVGAFEDHFVCE